MRKFILFLVIFCLTATGIYLKSFKRSPKAPSEKEYPKNQKLMGRLTLKSPAFGNNETVPEKYTCDGDNISPPLAIFGVPDGTKSLALIFDDPDAVGGVWDHWILWNISPEISEISENSFPSGSVQGKTSFGDNRYGGPCPPSWSGIHRYSFRLYALNTVISLNADSKKPNLEKAMEDHVLSEAVLTGLYKRK